MVPARQRLEAGDLAGRDFDDRLEMDLDRVVGDRGAQIEFDQAADLNLGVHRLLERAPVAAPFRLGGVERHVGVGEDRFGRLAVLRRARRADAGADDDFVTVDEHRPTDFAQDLLGELAGLAGIGDRALQDGEFVAAPARDDVGVAHDPLQPAGDRRQQLVAARVAEAVVDLLEIVEIEEQDVGAFDLVAAPAQGLDELLFEATAVRQIGHGIDARHAIDRAGGVAPFGDVLDDDDRALPSPVMRWTVISIARSSRVSNGATTSTPAAARASVFHTRSISLWATILRRISLRATARRLAPDWTSSAPRRNRLRSWRLTTVTRPSPLIIIRPCDMLLSAMSRRLASSRRLRTAPRAPARKLARSRGRTSLHEDDERNEAEENAAGYQPPATIRPALTGTKRR